VNNPALTAAMRYRAAGWAVVPIPPKTKGPVLKDWTKLQLTEADLPSYFRDEANVGVMNGTPSGGLVDVDIDSQEALAAAATFLPATRLIFGRASNRGSHWCYITTPLVETVQFKDVDGEKAMLIELRSTGTQTIWPGSVHPSGEPITFDVDNEPTVIDGNVLRVQVAFVAACALLARHWPNRAGSRHGIANALAGLLLRGGLEEEPAVTLVATAARIAGDEEWTSRGDDVRATAKALASGKNVTGRPTLADLLGDKVVAKLVEWLRLRQAQAAPASRNSGGSGPSQATRLISAAMAAEFFHTAEHEAYASVPVADHWETWPVKNKAFRRWLARRFHEETGTVAGNQAVQDAITVLEGRALYDGPESAVFLRVAQQDGALYLDLANDRWELVKITADRWEVTTNRHVRFRRPQRGMLALPTPVLGGSVDLLRPFINIDDEASWRLIVAWLLAAFRPTGPYPVLPLHGEHGAAKSTTARVLRACIDPNSAPLRSEPRSARDLMIAANNGWVIALDNLSRIEPWLSDALCRLATGGGFSTRELYSDADEVLFEAQRPVILTGIQELASREDLLDRSLVTYLPSIPEDHRQTEQGFWRAFQAHHPAILGALLDAVVSALRNLTTVEMCRLPRLADFAMWATAAEARLGWSAGSFMDAYRDNQEVANDLALDASPVTGSLRTLVEVSQGQFSDTARTLLDQLKKYAPDAVLKEHAWPKSPRALSGVLRRLAANLRRIGIAIEFGKSNGSNSRRLISIRRTGTGGDLSSRTTIVGSATPPTGESAPDAPNLGDDSCILERYAKEKPPTPTTPPQSASVPTSVTDEPGLGTVVEENGLLRPFTAADARSDPVGMGHGDLACKLAEHLKAEAHGTPQFAGAASAEA